MKKEKIYSIVFVILTIMLFLTILILSEPKDDFKPLNQIHMKKNQYKDGKEHGYWEYYYANGNIMFKGYYKDGKEHGYWEYYYPNHYNILKQFHI